MSNFYAQALDVVSSDDLDWKIMVVLIAQRHPKAVVEAARQLGHQAQLGWVEQARTLYRHDQKIDAIKLWRQNTGSTLKDAKEAVENLL